MNKPKNTIRMTKSDVIFTVFVYTFLSCLVIVVLYPLYFVVIASFSDPALVNTGQILLYPRLLNFAGYNRIFSYAEVWQGYGMSIYYTVAGTFFSICMTLPVAYALTVKRFKGRKIVTVYLMFTMFFGGGLIPTYLLVQQLNLYDKPYTLLFIGALSVYNIIITKSSLESNIPHEMYEAAAIDGCNHFKFFFRFILPLSKPIIAVIVLYYAVGRWNDFMNAMIYLQNQEFFPLQLILRNILIRGEMLAMDMLRADEALLRQQEAELIKYGLIVVSSIPLLIVYPFIQRYFTQGIMIGSVKG